MDWESCADNIERQTKDGFVFLIECSDANRAKLAAQIDWVKKKSVRMHDDKRSFKRFQPRDPRSTIALPDGKIAKCFVIDMSRSGAARGRPMRGPRSAPGWCLARWRRMSSGISTSALRSNSTRPRCRGLESLTTGFAPIGDIAPEVWPVYAALKIERAADLAD